MKVILKGFGGASDTLRVHFVGSLAWQRLTSLLAIPGVVYYYTDMNCFGVRYSPAVDVEDVAAVTLRVMADAHKIAPEALIVEVRDLLGNNVAATIIASGVQRRACIVPAPPAISPDEVALRGSGPVYYLRSPA